MKCLGRAVLPCSFAWCVFKCFGVETGNTGATPRKSQPCILKAVMWLSRIKYYQIADMLLAPSDTSCQIAIYATSVGTIQKAVWQSLDPLQSSCFESGVDLETVTLPLKFFRYCYLSQLLWCGSEFSCSQHFTHPVKYLYTSVWWIGKQMVQTFVVPWGWIFETLYSPDFSQNKVLYNDSVLTIWVHCFLLLVLKS